MISHNVSYHRDFFRDWPPVEPGQENTLKDRCRKLFLAFLPHLAMTPILRRPLTLGLNGVRAVTQYQQAYTETSSIEKAWHTAHGSAALLSCVLFFLAPLYGLLASTLSDATQSARELKEAVGSGNHKATLVGLLHLALDLLFLLSFCYGAIEITCALLLLQTMQALGQGYNSWKKGEWIEGISYSLLSVRYAQQLSPQAKLARWKWQTAGKCEATLKQDENGFVYLDIPDKYLHQLYAIFGKKGMQLPPYFGPGRAGGHISVISKEEAGGTRIAEVGKKIPFRITQVSDIKPNGWGGVDRVWFVTVSCSGAEKLRARYGFSPKIAGDHDFHITFAIKRKTE